MYMRATPDFTGPTKQASARSFHGMVARTAATSTLPEADPTLLLPFVNLVPDSSHEIHLACHGTVLPRMCLYDPGS
jgi:hypothetical protein